MALRQHRRVTLLFPLLIIAACVSQPDTPAGAGAGNFTGTSASPPGTATYSCADGGMVKIQNLGTSLRLLGPDGEVAEELPASPADQNSRYGANHDAVVLDGRDALIMKSGAVPLTCTR
jgi:hypothetical protein